VNLQELAESAIKVAEDIPTLPPVAPVVEPPMTPGNPSFQGCVGGWERADVPGGWRRRQDSPSMHDGSPQHYYPSGGEDELPTLTVAQVRERSLALERRLTQERIARAQEAIAAKRLEISA
jgi:hypothetical protein